MQQYWIRLSHMKILLLQYHNLVNHVLCLWQYGLDRILAEEKCLALLARAIDPTQSAMMTDIVKLLSAICIVGEENTYVFASLIISTHLCLYSFFDVERLHVSNFTKAKLSLRLNTTYMELLSFKSKQHVCSLTLIQIFFEDLCHILQDWCWYIVYWLMFAKV